ncbi:MAG: protein translocase subunit SecF [Anaerolineaceae bacterium]|jgi:preprotein translocase subunit SecF|nr:protein translocase subunit SecF [Anaerolineaceae bacterium]
MNILGKRYIFFAISLLAIIPGMIILITGGGLPLSIDFTGGSLLEVRFESGSAPNTEEVIALYNDLGYEDVQIKTTTDQNVLIIQSAKLEDEQQAEIVDAMEVEFEDTVTVLLFDNVSSAIGQEVTSRAFLAVAVAALGVILYMTFAFRGVEHAFRYGVCAILAMIHDVLIVLSLSAIGGKLWGWQFDSLALTALLTVIGFSVQDKIVVFDRMRENRNIYRKLDFETLANHSIIQTLGRSINTQLMTSEFMLLALALFGGLTLREFAILLLVGMFSGTYSSIFIAAPILVIWEKKEWKTWFKKNKAVA